MKIKRSWLLAATTGIALFMILYTVIKHFTEFTLGESFEKYFFDGIFLAAIGLLILNRKIASDERKEQEAKRADEIADTGHDGSEDITVVKSDKAEN